MNILFFGTASYDKASFTKELAQYPHAHDRRARPWL